MKQYLLNVLQFTVFATVLLVPQIGGGLAEASQQFTYDVKLEAVGANSNVIEEMDAQLRSFIDEQKVSSVVGFVSKGGKVVYRKAFGWKDVENEIPATVDDYYVLFSQTKGVTTVAFMTLVEQGLVSIHDPVSKYFPGISDEVVTVVHEDGSYETRAVESPMTFVHLMSHTSGLNAGLVREIKEAEKKGNDAPIGFGGAIPEKTPSGQHSGGGDYEAKFLEDEMLELAKYPLGFEPGSAWDYHVSTNMLGYMVERISGKSLQEYVKETVLNPLGMNETAWYYDSNKLDRFVKAYRSVDGELESGSNIYSQGTVSEQQTYAEGALGLNGPIEDYAKFCQMLLNKGEFNGSRILKAETIEIMTMINRLPMDDDSDDDFRFGLGFELHQGKKPSPAVSSTAFSWGGMLGTNYTVDPENDMIVLCYTNMFGGENPYPEFISKAYELFDSPEPSRNEKELLESVAVIIENGGTGLYSTIATEDSSLPGITIFRPKELSPFGSENKLPVLLWGNGACANSAFEHKNFLSEIASNGYIVLAIGLLNEIDHRADSGVITHSSQLLEALDWIEVQNESDESVYSGKIDVSKVAAMGMSCGGLQAIEISDDPRIRTTIVCNSGVLPEPSDWGNMPSLVKDDLKTDFKAPVLYIMGGPSDIAYDNAMDDFARVNHVPIVMTNLDVGHGGTYHKPHGGEFTPVALAWVDWQLKGKEEASRVFLGEDSQLAQNPEWTIEVKNFGDVNSDAISPLETEFVYEAVVTLGGFVEVGETSLGHRRYIPITGGTFEGPRIRGTILPGGADWQTERSDGVVEIDALYSMRCDDGTVIIIRNQGVVTEGGSYIRTAARFDVPMGPHDWLSRSQFVGSVTGGSEPGTVVIRIFRVL